MHVPNLHMISCLFELFRSSLELSQKKIRRIQFTSTRPVGFAALIVVKIISSLYYDFPVTSAMHIPLMHSNRISWPLFDPPFLLPFPLPLHVPTVHPVALLVYNHRLTETIGINLSDERTH